MSIMDDYKQLRMIENIKNFKEMELAYKSNLKLCKYQEQQINKLATCIEDIKEIAECCQTPANCKDYCQFYNECIDGGLPLILQKISECEVNNDR